MTLSSRVTAVVAYCCLFCALATATIGGLGIVGVRAATASEKSVTGDELQTALVTADFEHQVDAVYAEATGTLLGDSGPARRSALASLHNERVPAVESSLAALRRMHEGDDGEELADIDRLTGQWVALRTVVNGIGPAADGATTLERLRTTYRLLTGHLRQLNGREQSDAERDQAVTSGVVHRLVWGIVVGVLLTSVLFVLLGAAAARRLRQAIEPAREQVEFADTLQLAENETEAHELLQRHLQRLVSGSTVTVLNRNNSADRLEAVTPLTSGSPLAAGLTHAEPRSCLAVRSARLHEEDDQRPGLLGCAVCSGCPGISTCTPLNVGGEVIGSVLVNRDSRPKPIERRQVQDAVGQAAPVLANLRNLAIAEVRAATDSLTGLPNKRAVADTLKRMTAQAARTLSPLSLLVLDLDHFKDLNDRFGHQVGDQALANVGAALRSALRESDFAGRNGGEEFAILLPDTDLVGALATAEKIRGSIAEISLPGLELTVSASIGVAVYPDHAVGPERLERLADSALFVAKRSGRNRVEVAAAQDEPVAESAAGSGPLPH